MATIAPLDCRFNRFSGWLHVVSTCCLLRHFVFRFGDYIFDHWARHATPTVFVPDLEAVLSPPVSAKACSSNQATCEHRAVRTINITRRVLVSQEDANRLRSSWLTGEFNHIENRKQGLTRMAPEWHLHGWVQGAVALEFPLPLNLRIIPNLHANQSGN